VARRCGLERSRQVFEGLHHKSLGTYKGISKKWRDRRMRWGKCKYCFCPTKIMKKSRRWCYFRLKEVYRFYNVYFQHVELAMTDRSLTKVLNEQ